MKAEKFCSFRACHNCGNCIRSLFINSSEFQSFSPLEDTPRDKINKRVQSAILKTRSRELKQKGSQL